MSEAIKTSNIKPGFDSKEIEEFVVTSLDGIGTLKKLVEGHTSQAFSFNHEDGTKRVLRIAPNNEGFLLDRYAFKRFASSTLPIPRIYDIGNFRDDSYYCVSQFVEGKPSDQLTQEEMTASLEAQLQCFAQLFNVDIHDVVGWGEINASKDEAPFTTWQESIRHSINDLDENFLTEGLKSLGLDKSLYKRFMTKFEENMERLSDPVKRLVHGDLGFDNVLVNKGEVAAIIDWADVGCGDWVFDMARCEFWHPGKYGNIKKFGEKHSLDCSMLDQRINSSIAFTALTTLDYAIQYESNSTKKWLKTYLSSKLD